MIAWLSIERSRKQLTDFLNKLSFSISRTGGINSKCLKQSHKTHMQSVCQRAKRSENKKTTNKVRHRDEDSLFDWANEWFLSVANTRKVLEKKLRTDRQQQRYQFRWNSDEKTDKSVATLTNTLGAFLFITCVEIKMNFCYFVSLFVYHLHSAQSIALALKPILFYMLA